MLYVFLFACGSAVGVVSGMLGLGGGIIMFPLLLYLPPSIGLGEIDVRSITGLTMAQGFFASLSAALFYGKHRLVNRRLVLVLGLSMLVSSLAGSLSSGMVPEETILLVFGVLAVLASAMMFLPRSYSRDEQEAGQVAFSLPLAVAIGTVLGFFLGMVGQGGAFIIIPVLLYVLGIPLRVALGSTLAIGLFSSTAGLAGKLVTSQVPLVPALAMLAGTVPAARLGGHLGRRSGVRHLRWVLAAVITGSAVKILTDIL